MHDRLQRSKRIRAQLIGKLGREPTPEELAPELGTDTRALDVLDQLTREAVSLESTVAGSEKRLEDYVADPHGAAPDAGLDGDRMSRGVGQLIRVLNTREQLIVRLRYGLACRLGPRQAWNRNALIRNVRCVLYCASS